MNDRYRAAPVALARYAPVTQAIIDGAGAKACVFQCLYGAGFGGINRQPVEKTGVDSHAIAGKSVRSGFEFRCKRSVVRLVGGSYNGCYRQIIFSGKIKVALVVCRAPKDRPGAVVHQHEVGDIDRQMLALDKRVLRCQAGIEPPLFSLFDCFLAGADAGAVGGKISNGGVGFCDALRQRMLWGDCAEGCPEQCVRAGGKNLQHFIRMQIISREGKKHPRALRPADPVLLHQPDFFGPAVQRIQACDQVFGKVRNLQEPLGQFALLNGCA